MVASSISLTCFSPCLSNKLNHSSHSNESPPINTAISSFNVVVAGTETASNDAGGRSNKNLISLVMPLTMEFSGTLSLVVGHLRRRPLLLGLGTLTASVLPANHPLKAEEIPARFREFVDFTDGYCYIYPQDWKDFDFRGHDSAFKDRYLQLQNVRVRFIPTQKNDIHDLGPMEEVINNLVKHVYAAPNQRPTIYDMQERSVGGKNYYTFEYVLTSPNYSSASFATIGIGNGRYYTLIVGALERRWRRVRDKLKVVADSFKILDI